MPEVVWIRTKEVVASEKFARLRSTGRMVMRLPLLAFRLSEVTDALSHPEPAAPVQLEISQTSFDPPFRVSVLLTVRLPMPLVPGARVLPLCRVVAPLM